MILTIRSLGKCEVSRRFEVLRPRVSELTRRGKETTMMPPRSIILDDLAHRLFAKGETLI